MSIPSRAHGDGRQSEREFPSGCVFRLCEIQISSREAWFYSSSQARGNAREILNAGPAVVLHGVERSVGSAKKFLGRVAILRESSDACADRKGRVLRLSREKFADSRDDARRDVLAGFRQYEREFIAAVSRGRVDRAGMITQNLADTHQRAAAGQMPVVIVDNLEAVHVEKHDAEWALRAARTVKLGFKNADEAAVIRQPREWVGHSHRTDLLEEPRLIQQRPG